MKSTNTETNIPQTVVALDPGGTTGFAVAENSRFVESFEVSGICHHLNLWSLLTTYEPDVVVCESFTYRNGLTKAELISCEYIGVARLWCLNAAPKGVPFVLQGPAQGKCREGGLWSPTKLKNVGLYQPGKPHANDATAHLLFYFTTMLRDLHYLNLSRS